MGSTGTGPGAFTVSALISESGNPGSGVRVYQIRERLVQLGWEVIDIQTHGEPTGIRWTAIISRIGATAESAHDAVFKTFQSFGVSTTQPGDWYAVPIKAVSDVVKGAGSTLAGVAETGKKAVGTFAAAAGFTLVVVGLVAVVILVKR